MEDGTIEARPQSLARRRADLLRREALKKLKACLNEQGAICNLEAAGALHSKRMSTENKAPPPVGHQHITLSCTSYTGYCARKVTSPSGSPRNPRATAPAAFAGKKTLLDREEAILSLVVGYTARP